MEASYSLRSPAVKRLMKEAQELKDPTEQFFAQPLDDNLFEWHFTIRGPADSEFEHGIYHGRIILPPEYPMKPPSIILLTPNGRFETNKKICLSISGHHPESWQPSWSLRTALLAIIGFMPTHGNGAIGSLDYTADERKLLARKSLEWKCPNCGPIHKFVLPVTEASKALNKEAKELGSQINLQGEKEKSAAASSSPEASSADPSPAAADQSAGAAGPLPPSDSAPTFPTFPYFVDPRMMFPPGAGQQPNAMGGGTLNPNNPVIPPMFLPPFMPNMQYNPLFMPQPWLPGSHVPPMYGSQVYPPGYPMPGYWMGSGQFPPTATVPGIGAVPPPNVSGQPLRSDTGGTTTADQPSTSAASSTGNSQQSSQSQSPSGSKEAPISKRSADVEPASVSPPSSGAPPPKEASSSAKQPAAAAAFVRAGAAAGAEAANGEADDPVPSASQLRQRNVAQESSQVTTGRLRRTNQPAELPRGQSSSSYSIGHLMLNIIVAILVLCIVALLSRRLYLLG